MAKIQIPQFKFLSQNIAQGVWESIITANMEGEITIFDSQKYSKKVQGWMNALLPKRKEFKEDEVRKAWKSYVKFSGVLMMKELTDKKYEVFAYDPWNILLTLWYTCTVFLG